MSEGFSFESIVIVNIVQANILAHGRTLRGLALGVSLRLIAIDRRCLAAAERTPRGASVLGGDDVAMLIHFLCLTLVYALWGGLKSRRVTYDALSCHADLLCIRYAMDYSLLRSLHDFHLLAFRLDHHALPLLSVQLSRQAEYANQDFLILAREQMWPCNENHGFPGWENGAMRWIAALKLQNWADCATAWRIIGGDLLAHSSRH